MFRRLSSGLPKDPTYPPTLEGLGYFVNENDEIRSIENPKAFFKFFLTKNERYNLVQREAMNQAIREIVEERLVAIGLQKTIIPLNAPLTTPHLHIFTSPNLSIARRIVVLFYEPKDDIGIFAHRLLGGGGGIDVGSAVSLCRYIQEQHTSPSDLSPPAIILANTGQLRWWRKGQKAVTQTTWFALPQASAVDKPYRFDKIKNTIEGNRDIGEHTDYIFNHVISELAHPEAKINIIGVSEGAMAVSHFLEQPANWEKWGSRVQAFAAIATWYQSIDCKNPLFLEWMLARSRVYTLSSEPEGTFLVGPEGNKRSLGHGSPVFSLGEPFYTECMLPKGYKTVLQWFQEVAEVDDTTQSGNGGGYRNPVFLRQDDDNDGYTDLGFGDEGFEDEERGDGIELKIEDSATVQGEDEGQ
ncbi:hypothetical protein ACMFMG_004791 [Clarireedia jacksonii]